MEASNYPKHSNQIHLSQNSIYQVRFDVCFFCSLNTGNKIGDEGVIELAEALRANSTLTSLNLTRKYLLLRAFISFSFNTDNKIDIEGAIQLSAALKSNSSLTSLNLSGIRIVASFRTHTI
jgi:hypothetical protein